MPFISVPSTAMVELFYRWDNQRVENTLYFRQADSYDPPELTTLAEEVFNWWANSIAPLTSSSVVLVGVKATSLESDSAPAVETPVNQPGLGDPNAEPNNVSFVIKFLTSGRGRSSRGRNYIVGLPDTTVNGNSIQAAHADALVAAYSQLLAAGVITEGAWSVVSRYADGLPRSPGIAQLVTGASYTDLTIDSQRRRLPGRGT